MNEQMVLIGESSEAWAYRRMLAEAEVTVKAYMSDVTKHDRLAVMSGQWRRFVWLLRETGTDLVYTNKDNGLFHQLWFRNARMFKIDLDERIFQECSYGEAERFIGTMPDVSWLKWSTYEGDDRKAPKLVHLYHEESGSWDTGYLYVGKSYDENGPVESGFWHTGKGRIVGAHTEHCRHGNCRHEDYEFHFSNVVSWCSTDAVTYPQRGSSGRVYLNLRVNRPVADFMVE